MERHSLENLLDFIDKYSTESGLQWEIDHLYDINSMFEIHWLFDKTSKMNWYVKKKVDPVWMNVVVEDLLKYLIKEHANLGALEYKILMDICFQTVCSYLYIDKANELLGKENVDAAVDRVRKLFYEEEKKPKLRILKTED